MFIFKRTEGSIIISTELVIACLITNSSQMDSMHVAANPRDPGVELLETKTSPGSR